MGKLSYFENLPREIMAEILSRLSPDSLMRFKSLNKSLYFIIKCLVVNPEFVAKHLRHSKAYPETLLVCQHQRRVCEPPEKNPGLPEFFLNESIASMVVTRLVDNGDGEGGIRSDAIEVVNLPHFLLRNDMYGLEVYHCNGIVCVTKDFKTLTLCNPAVRELEVFQPLTDLAIDEYEIYGMGIGSDLDASNFKIVRFLSPMKAEVFNLGTILDSWREVEISLQVEQFGRVEDHVYSKGNCFWSMVSVPLTVLWFNVCNEIFRSIPVPNELRLSDDEDPFWRLTMHNDSVCLFWYPFEEPMDMWAIDIDNDYGYSWRKCLRITFDCVERFYVPFAFWKNDELLVDEEDVGIVSYNLRTRKLRSLIAFEKFGDVHYWGLFVKSLASIKQIKQA